MANGDDSGTAYGDGPTAFGEGPKAYDPPGVKLSSTAGGTAAGYQTQVPSQLGTLDPSYPQQRDAALSDIAQRESQGRNVRNPASTASGPWQMTDPTWRTGAALAGVPTRRYPTARSAPYPVQQQIARAIYDQYGEKPWAQTVRSSPVVVAGNALKDYTGR